MSDKKNRASYLEQGIEHHQSGDLANAEIFYSKAIEQFTDASKAFNYLGLIHFSKSKINEATDAWVKSMELDSDFIDPLVNLGISKSQAQAFQESLGYFEKACEIDPSREDIVMHIVQLHMQMKDFKAAQDMLTPLIKQSPINLNAQLIYAQIKTLSGDHLASQEVLNQILVAFPDLPEALVNLGHLSTELGKPLEAKHYFITAATKHPNHLVANFEAGKFLCNHEEVENGLRFLQKATELQPDDWALFYHQGDAYQKLGQFDKAIVSFKKALSLNPDSVIVKQNLSRSLTRFVPPWHLKMLADHARNDAFEKAIEKAVNSETTVLDIGTGSGILSLMAAKHGAKRVFTCEQSPYLADVAKEIIQKNGFENKIEVFNLKSTELSVSNLKDRPNLIIAEIFDSGLIGELAIPTFRHALKELCDEQCRIIPRGAEIIGRLINTPGPASVNPIQQVSGFDLSPFDQFRIPKEYISGHLGQVEHQFLSDEFHMAKYNFEFLSESIAEDEFQKQEISVSVSQSGLLHGVAFWFNLFLDETLSLSSGPERKDNHWGQAIFYFEAPVRIKKGEFFTLNMYYNDTRIWFEQN